MKRFSNHSMFYRPRSHCVEIERPRGHEAAVTADVTLKESQCWTRSVWITHGQLSQVGFTWAWPRLWGRRTEGPSASEPIEAGLSHVRKGPVWSGKRVLKIGGSVGKIIYASLGNTRQGKTGEGFRNRMLFTPFVHFISYSIFKMRRMRIR